MVKKGELTVYFGPMFCGKTSTLIYAYHKLVKEGVNVLCVKPAIDDRYGDSSHLFSHNELQSPATLLKDTLKPEEILEIISDKTELVIVDEIMFLSDKILQVIEKLLAQGIDVIVGGLMTDSEGRDFGPMRELSSKADHIAELFAVCDFVGCAQPASMSYAKNRKESQVEVGMDQYGACCPNHHGFLNKGGEARKSMADKHENFSNMKIYPGYVEWFESLEFPLLRKKASVGTQPNIEVGADSLRVGKTTAVEVLAKGLSENGNGVVGSFEDFASNPYLKESYSDPRNAILHSQQWFATRKHEQVSGAPADKVFVQDVHPEMDFCYAVTNVLVGRMSLKQFEKYKEHYFGLDWESVSQPDLLIYLKASDDVLLDRAKRSLRDFEEVDENYFLVMKMVNRAWLRKARKHMQVIEVDTDDLDFSTDEKAKNELVRMTKQRLSKSKKKTNIVHENVYGSMDGVVEKLTKNNIVILSGLPGSGKSYLAHKLQKEFGYSYLSTDVIRLSKVYKNQVKYLDTVDEYVKTRELVYDLLHKSAFRRIKKGKKVVIDATYLGPQREELLGLLKENDLLDDAIMAIVKVDEAVIRSRMLGKKLENGEDYTAHWERAYNWFIDQLQKKKIRYPDQKLDKVKVIEVWNQ